MGMTITPDGRQIWVPDFVSPFVPGAPGDGGQPGGDPYFDPSQAPPPPAPAPPPIDPRMAQVMAPPAVDHGYEQRLKDAQFSASFPDQRVNDAQYAMQRYGLTQDEAIAATTGQAMTIKDPARQKLVKDAAFDLAFPDQRVNIARHLQQQYGLTTDDAIKIAGQQGGAAHIAQAAGPMGTIGQIGKGGGPTTGADLLGIDRPLPTFSQADLDATKPPLTPAQQKAQASPDGQTVLGQQQQQNAISAQEEVARATGAVQGQELDAVARDEREGFARANRIREQANRERQERTAGIQQRQAELERLIGQESSIKIDDNRRWHDMNTGKKLVAVMAMAMSGLGEALMGKAGPNPVIGMIDKAIQDDVAAQVRERDQAGKRIGLAKSSLDSYRSITGDMAEAQRLKLSEEYDRTAQQIRATSAQYASPKAKLQAEAIAQQLQEKAGALRGATAEVMWNRDVQKQQLANQRQQTAIAGGHLNLANKQFEYQMAHDADLLKLQAAGLDIEAQKLTQAGQGKAAELVLKQGIPAPPVAVQGEDGKVTLQPGGTLKNADGSPLVAPTEKEAQDLRAQMSTARQIVDMLDEVREIRNRVGGESSWGNSTDYQRIQVLKENLVKIEKAGTQGMSSDADMKRLELTLGADNPASFRSQAGKLEEARKLVEHNLNAELKYKGGYTGPAITFTDPLGAGAPETADDVEFKQSLKTPSMTDKVKETESPTEDGVYAKDMQRAYDFNTTGTTKHQRDLIQSYVDIAANPKSSPAQRDMALSRLYAGSQQGQYDEIKNAYADALQKVQNENLGQSPMSQEETSGKVQYSGAR